MKGEQLFFVGQKAFIEKDNKVLVLFDSSNRLDFPGGKIQEGESDLETSLMREVKEETNLSVSVHDPFAVWSFVLSDGHGDKGRMVFLVGFECSLEGGKLKLSNEHVRYRWIGKDTLSEVNDGSKHFHALEKYFGSR